MKRVKIALAVVFVALVGVIVWQALSREREPVYKGKKLSEWSRDYWQEEPPDRAATFYRVNPEAREALHEVGTRGIPTFLRWLRASDSASAWKVKVVGWIQHFIRISYTPAETWNRFGVTGFEELGSDADAAVPALIAIANEGISSSSRMSAIHSLGYIGPPAKAAVPLLLQWATNADVNVGGSARFSLLLVDPEAAAKAGITNGPSVHAPEKPLHDFELLDIPIRNVPILLQRATNADSSLRGDAIVALGYILRASPVQVLPVLTNALHDPSLDVRCRTARVLGHYGPSAKMAVPALVESLNDSEPIVRMCARDALKAIDPEAAAKAGVK